MEVTSEFSVGEDVVKFVNDIIANNNWDPVSDIKYQQGSVAGDGYFSRTVAVEIETGKGTHHLFLKCAPKIIKMDLVAVEGLYKTEIIFYKKIVPAFKKFAMDHNAEDGFRNAPASFGVLGNEIIAMENLRIKGYTLFRRDKVMNHNHLVMVFKTFAKFHALSFAYKDQHEEDFHRLCEGTFNVFAFDADVSPAAKMFKTTIEEFISKLNPVEDKDILEKMDADGFIRFLSKGGKSDKYSVLCHGDCWCNNMMFLYEKGNTENPIDIMLIDWQVLNHSSAVFDLAFFFYTSASEEALSKLEQYLKIYHDELSNQIRQLGSDPDILYPFEIMEIEWREYCKYGYVIAFNHVRALLASPDETVDLEKVDKTNTESLIPKFDEKEYTRRMKYLSRFMIKNNYI